MSPERKAVRSLAKREPVDMESATVPVPTWARKLQGCDQPVPRRRALLGGREVVWASRASLRLAPKAVRKASRATYALQPRSYVCRSVAPLLGQLKTGPTGGFEVVWAVGPVCDWPKKPYEKHPGQHTPHEHARRFAEAS